jgi:hypothetical protein
MLRFLNAASGFRVDSEPDKTDINYVWRRSNCGAILCGSARGYRPAPTLTTTEIGPPLWLPHRILQFAQTCSHILS